MITPINNVWGWDNCLDLKNTSFIQKLYKKIL